MHVRGFDLGWMAKFSNTKCCITFFPYLPKAGVYHQMEEEIYADAALFAIFMYSDVLLWFLDFENILFYIVKITFCSKVTEFETFK